MDWVRIFCWLLMPLAVQAQTIYKCIDPGGRTLTADRPMAECAGRATKELDKHGVLRRETPALPTAEETQLQLEQEEIRREEAELASQKSRNDKAIMSRFRSEADILRARKRTLDPLLEQARRTHVVLANAEAALKEIKRQAAALPPSTPQLAELTQRLEEAQQYFDEHRILLFAREAEIKAVQSRFTAILTRYRELNPAAQAK